MRLGTMLGNVLQSLFRRPVTQIYPYEKEPAPERLRGKLTWDPARCTGCQLCIKDCPSDAIELIVLDKAAKRFVIKFYADRCTFCGQCVENCRFNCLGMSSTEWELASIHRQPFTVYYGNDSDIEFLLGRSPKDSALAPGED